MHRQGNARKHLALPRSQPQIAPNIMFLANRGRQGPDPSLRIRTALLIVGAGIVLAGMRVGKPWAVNVGIGVLLVAVVIRLIMRRRTARSETDDG